MKTRLSLLALGTVLAFGSLAIAQDAPPTEGPCRKIADACRAAGYAKGAAKEGRGLFKNCMSPVLAGQPVAGVTVDPADVQACNAKRATRHPH